MKLEHIEPSDIIRLRDGNHQWAWWVSQRLLLLADVRESYLWKKARPSYTNTVSPSKRDKMVLPDTGKPWRYAKVRGSFYYAYNNLPERVREIIGTADRLLEIANSNCRNSRVFEIQSVVERRLNEGKSLFLIRYAGYRKDHVNDLARACAALALCIELGEDRGELLAPSGQWFRDFAEIMERLDVRYMPRNWRTLKEKVALVLGGKEVWEVIDLPRAGNQNARKLTDPEIESWVIQMRGMPQNFTGAHIARRCIQMCLLTGKPVPSESWFSSMLAQPAVQFLSSAGRYGERGMHGQAYRGYTPVANALFAGDAWQADGTRVNFVPWKGPDGREQYLFMVVIRDVHSGAVLGEHYCLNEDRWAYLNALRMAVNTAGHLPWSLMLDRFPGHNTPEWQMVEQRMTMFGVDVQYKHSATGKAQLERWFETLQSVFFQSSPWYYGEGIRSTRKAAHRTAEYVRGAKKAALSAGWGMDAAVREVQRCIREYNDTPINTYSRKHSAISASPVGLWNASEKPHIRVLDPYQRVLLFGLTKRVSIRHMMIRTEIEREERLYPIEDYDTVKNHRTVLLAYFLDDPSKAWVFADDDSRPVNPPALCEVQAMERVQVFGPNADYKALGKDQKRIRDIRARAQEEMNAYRQVGEVEMLLGGTGRKADLEAAESAALAEMYGDSPRLLAAANQAQETNERQEPEEEFDVERWVLSQM